MKKLWTILLISLIGLNVNLVLSNTSKKSLKFDPKTSVGKPKEHIELLLLVDNILDEIKKDAFNGKKDKDTDKSQKNALIKKANQDIVRLKRIKQHLKKLEETNDDMQKETRKEIKQYKETKQNLINSAQRDINSLIKIEKHLIKLEEDDTADHEKEKETHRKHKNSIILRVQEKVAHLLRIERKLIELTKNNPKEHKEAETIYYETEFLKGPEIQDRETVSIDDAQYREHLRKDISKYSPDYHDKIANYFRSNT